MSLGKMIVNKHNITAFQLPLVVVFITLFAACGNPPFYEENKVLSSGEWPRAAIQDFTVETEDSTAAYDFYLNARNGGNYAYNNLWVFFHTTDPLGNRYTDTIECPFADKSGRWLGTSASGGMWDNRVLFKNKVALSKPGKYQFRIEQAMRDSVLENIFDIGLRIEKAH